MRLARDPALRRCLGTGLQRHVETQYATTVVVPAWIDLFDGLAAEPRARAAPESA